MILLIDVVLDILIWFYRDRQNDKNTKWQEFLNRRYNIANDVEEETLVTIVYQIV